MKFAAHSSHAQHVYVLQHKYMSCNMSMSCNMYMICNTAMQWVGFTKQSACDSFQCMLHLKNQHNKVKQCRQSKTIPCNN